MKTIALIIPYFGKFREDFPFFLKSAELNPTISFYVFTDQKISNAPANVFIIEMTFGDCLTLMEKRLCLHLDIYPYKLCDLKPSYGLVFQDYIHNYDFWGHCDCDLIFGDIRHFITDDVLTKFDRVLSRGHFTLYRNNPHTNEMFKKASPNYQIVFNSNKIYHFDEHPCTGKYWFENLSDFIYDKIIFDDLDWRKFLFKDVHKYSTIDKLRRHFVYLFENGKLYRVFWENHQVRHEEIMYAHFQKRRLKVATDVYNKFIIIPNQIVNCPECIDYDYLFKNTQVGVAEIMQYEFINFIRYKWNSLVKKVKIYLNIK